MASPPLRSTASDRAYQEIRAFILAGDVAPGAALTEEALADIVGVSRTPVREALRRLEAEHYITRNSSQRLFVANWSQDDLAEMFTLRAMLEAQAAARAATRIADAALAELAAINARITAAITQDALHGGPDIATFLTENRAFHEVIICESGSPRLATILATLVEQPVIRRTAARYSAQELARSAHEHSQMIQALTAHDAEWARSVMTAHIRRAFHTFTTAAPAK